MSQALQQKADRRGKAGLLVEKRLAWRLQPNGSAPTARQIDAIRVLFQRMSSQRSQMHCSLEETLEIARIFYWRGIALKIRFV